jgi:lipoyl(octanoyl) transferase
MMMKSNILPQWQLSPDLVPYPDALSHMEHQVAKMAQGQASEQVWLLQHPPLYTAGTSAKATDLLNPQFPVYEAGRGGQYTYHGPGQRVAYVMLDLNQRQRDLRAYVQALEEWVILSLFDLGVQASRRDGRVGLWVPRSDNSGLDDKIAAIGVRVKRWITFHGIAINHSPDLTHFAGIVPCGIREHGVTSLALLAPHVTMDDLDTALKTNWPKVF